MRARIAEAKRPAITVGTPPGSATPQGGLADERGKLAALRAQGVLDDVESRRPSRLRSRGTPAISDAASDSFLKSSGYHTTGQKVG